MANEAYVRKGTAIVLGHTDNTPNYVWTVTAVANGAGRVSAQIDLGEAPRPGVYVWSAVCQWQATPTQGAMLEFYAAGAPDGSATAVDGNLGQSDAAVSDADKRRNLLFIGGIVSEEAAANDVCRASGRFEWTERYLSLLAWNAGGSAIHATAANFVFTLQPVYWQGQA